MAIKEKEEVVKPNSWEDERPHFEYSNVLSVFKLCGLLLLTSIVVSGCQQKIPFIILPGGNTTFVSGGDVCPENDVCWMVQSNSDVVSKVQQSEDVVFDVTT